MRRDAMQCDAMAMLSLSSVANKKKKNKKTRLVESKQGCEK
jgi:hypothetical protein